MVESTSTERQTFETKLYDCESEILKLSGLTLSAFERHWACFEHESVPFKARYFMFGDQTKPVLVMTHGYASKSLSHFMLFKRLSEHFRVIFFDNCSWGGNTRLQNATGLDSPEKANAQMLAWLVGFFGAIDHLLPEKVLMYGPSNGAYQLGLYASHYPERVAKLFLVAPVGFLGILPEDEYDVYSVRVQDKFDRAPPRAKVDQLVRERENNVHAFGTLPAVEGEKRQAKFFRMAQGEFEGYPEAVHEAMGAYKDLMFSHIGQLEIVYRKPFKYLFQAYHALSQPDRLLNGQHFPIGVCYGDRDFMGSEGAEEVVKTNKFFASGQSQLFKARNAGHLPHIQNPDELLNIMIGFFQGATTGRFEPKPRTEFVEARPNALPNL